MALSHAADLALGLFNLLKRMGAIPSKREREWVGSSIRGVERVWKREAGLRGYRKGPIGSTDRAAPSV